MFNINKKHFLNTILVVIVLPISFYFCKKQNNKGKSETKNNVVKVMDKKSEDTISKLYINAKQNRAELGYTSDYDFEVKRPKDVKTMFCLNFDLANRNYLKDKNNDQYYAIQFSENSKPLYLESFSIKQNHLNFEIKLFAERLGLIYSFYNDYSHSNNSVNIVNGFLYFDTLHSEILFFNFNNGDRPSTNRNEESQEDISTIMKLDNELYPISMLRLNRGEVLSHSDFIYRKASRELEYELVCSDFPKVTLDKSTTITDILNIFDEIGNTKYIEKRKSIPDLNNYNYPLWLWENYEYKLE